MKIRQLFPLLALAGVVMFSSTGCKKDKDPDRLAFLGSYTVLETCSISGNLEYSISITESSTSESDVVINNFGDFGAPIRATVNGNNLTIASQNITVQGVSITVSNGAGSLNGNLLNINYSYAIAGNSESCVMNCTKL